MKNAILIFTALFLLSSCMTRKVIPLGNHANLKLPLKAKLLETDEQIIAANPQPLTEPILNKTKFFVNFYETDGVLIGLSNESKITDSTQTLSKYKKAYDYTFSQMPSVHTKTELKEINANQVLIITTYKSDRVAVTFMCNDKNKTQTLGGGMRFFARDSTMAKNILNDILKDLQL